MASDWTESRRPNGQPVRYTMDHYPSQVFVEAATRECLQRRIVKTIRYEREFTVGPKIQRKADASTLEEALASLREFDKIDEHGWPTHQSQYSLDVRTLLEHHDNIPDTAIRRLCGLVSDRVRYSDDTVDEAFDAIVDDDIVDDWESDPPTCVPVPAYVGTAIGRDGGQPDDGRGLCEVIVARLVEDLGYVLSNRTGRVVPLGEWGRTTGAYVATVHVDEAGVCPECGADKAEHWTCTASSNRTRVPNVYECEACGHTTRGITTG